MAVYDVGDNANLRHEVRVDGVLTNTTVTLAVTAPDGTASAPTVTPGTTGIYTATVPVTMVGPWRYTFTMSGVVVDIALGDFSARYSPMYASVGELRTYLGGTGSIGVSDGSDDGRLTDVLRSVSREIDRRCDRRFYGDQAATARIYYPTDLCMAEVDDFWTTTGLVVEADYGGVGTFTAWTSTDYELSPLNNIVDGEAGWPFYRITTVNRYWPAQRIRAGLRVTAKWGWASTPDPVHEACLMMASETFRLKGAPFGVANADQFGPIRVRDNPMAMSKLGPYMRHRALVG